MQFIWINAMEFDLIFLHCIQLSLLSLDKSVLIRLLLIRSHTKAKITAQEFTPVRFGFLIFTSLKVKICLIKKVDLSIIICRTNIHEKFIGPCCLIK